MEIFGKLPLSNHKTTLKQETVKTDEKLVKIYLSRS